VFEAYFFRSQELYGAQMPLGLQLFVLGHIVCVRQAPGFTHAQDPAAWTELGTSNDAMIGAAMTLAIPTRLIISRRLGDGGALAT
jgi:hypothetical protein